jgi:sporulation integral membrane protein YlbJ
MGSIGGYPVGVRTAAQLYEHQQCTKQDTLHLSAFCNNCGPAFLFSVAGVGVFSSKSAGVLLLATHLVAALMVGFLFRFYPFPKEKDEKDLTIPLQKDPSFSSAFPDCVRDSFSSTLNVCAFVILFSVLLRLANCAGLLWWAAEHLSKILPCVFTPAFCHSLIAGIFEVSTGVYSLSEICNSPAALPLAAFMLGWGGLSVHCQSLSFLNRCASSLVPYFLGKLMQGVFAATLTALFTSFFININAPANVSVPTAFWGVSTIELLQQELLALWFLSGAYFLLHWKKGLEKPINLDYNKSK